MCLGTRGKLQITGHLASQSCGEQRDRLANNMDLGTSQRWCLGQQDRLPSGHLDIPKLCFGPTITGHPKMCTAWGNGTGYQKTGRMVTLVMTIMTRQQ
ncbi:hypothetical protein AVEN_172544-1 [Araneus ventricosus]|uniref:Uncharacterized protein n=1 Tax=Araneus ventricosus TaxID=182803 RepID=A0A4Y2ME71_ARAVE|nr:hypothetical protein AVEN_172544-1 [Araneus ventricosus]